MRPPGLLRPEDFENLTDDELLQVKGESEPGSHYSEWANLEIERRDRVKRAKAATRWKFADIPHPLTIVFTLTAILIAGVSLWVNFSKASRAISVSPGMAIQLSGWWVGKFGENDKSDSFRIMFAEGKAFIPTATVGGNRIDNSCNWTSEDNYVVIVTCNTQFRSRGGFTNNSGLTLTLTLNANTLDGTATLMFDNFQPPTSRSWHIVLKRQPS